VAKCLSYSAGAFEEEKKALETVEKYRRRAGMRRQRASERRREKADEERASRAAAADTERKARDLAEARKQASPPRSASKEAALSDAALSVEQTNLVSQFLAVAGLDAASVENDEYTKLLRCMSWDLNKAVQAYYNNCADIGSALKAVLTQSKGGGAAPPAYDDDDASVNAGGGGGGNPFANAAAAKSEQAEIKVRLPTGEVLERHFAYDETMWSVYTWVAEKWAAGNYGDAFTLMVPYPKRLFGETELCLTIAKAGFTPSGALVAKLGAFEGK
jgi:hypothetical protein